MPATPRSPKAGSDLAPGGARAQAGSPRLTGLETEYAIRFTPARVDDGEGPVAPSTREKAPPAWAPPAALAAEGRRASNIRVFNAIMRAMSRRVRMMGEPAKEAELHHAPLFVENGGAFNYEVLGLAPHGGLLEGSTPECTSAGELVTYQRAQEALLADALEGATAELAAAGYPGTVSLLKNCRDAEGHLYGAQENYTVEVARGLRLLVFRLGLALLLPLHLAFAAFCWLLLVVLSALALACVPVFVVLMLFSLFVPPLARWLDRVFGAAERDPDKTHRPRYGRAIHAIDRLFSAVAITPWALTARAFALHDIQRQLTAFLISRPCLTGAGTLVDGDRFHLCEKAVGVRHLMRIGADADARAIYELPNVLKAAERLVRLKPSALAAAFRRHQRLQISLSDSNMAQVAEYLKIGTTLIVLDMIEGGALTDAPMPEDPVAALHAINADPSLAVAIPLQGGGEKTALALQRFYLDRATTYVNAQPVVALETQNVLRLWRQALDALETDPGTLVGRLDWVTKRLMLEQCADDANEVKKKIDLRYHELTDGYFRELERAGAAPRLVDEAAVQFAMTAPPARSPAALRGRLIAELADTSTTLTVDWDRVRIGGMWRGKVIRLDDYRRR